jgi:hypothetical protein
MITYVINLCTDTKNTDRYDKVAVNKFPMIIRCKDVDILKECLVSADMESFIKDHLKLKHLYNSAVFYIRSIDNNKIDEFYWNVPEIIQIEY